MNPILKLIGEAEDFSEYEDILALDAEQDKTLFDRPTLAKARDVYAELETEGPAIGGKAAESDEDILAKSAKYAYEYARNILNGRFQKGEDAIRASARYAYRYALWLIKPGDFVPDSKRWPAAESAIARDPKYALLYAQYIIHGRWPDGEEAIRSDPTYSQDYDDYLDTV